MKNNPENLTIGRFARAAGVNVETIRFYQRIRIVARARQTLGEHSPLLRKGLGSAEVRQIRAAIGFQA